MQIYCNGCNTDVEARLTDGAEVYPHRTDLAQLPFWICDTCKNYVGCHHKTDSPTKPKGSIPTKEVRQWRLVLHRKVDRMWMRASNKRKQRQRVYAYMSDVLGYTYHAGDVRTKEQYEAANNAANRVSKRLKKEGLL